VHDRHCQSPLSPSAVHPEISLGFVVVVFRGGQIQATKSLILGMSFMFHFVQADGGLGPGTGPCNCLVVLHHPWTAVPMAFAGWNHTQGPPPGKWERATQDTPGHARTWGLKVLLVLFGYSKDYLHSLTGNKGFSRMQ
jgi:hypothetical protein